MPKWIFLSCIAAISLYGNDRVELFGSTADVNDTTVRVSGSPVVIYQDHLMNADEMIYDREHQTIEATGSVNLFKANQYHVLGEYAKIDLANDAKLIRPYFMYDASTGLWVSTQTAETCKNEIDLTDGSVSGCESSDPLWKFRFSSGYYDEKKMWVDLYNARLEVNDVPVFYLPYFGYPTDRRRRSGLLIPYFGLSSNEGFFYQQPVYFAPSTWWDLELRPQIRTSRGQGIYADFRFVDTPSSEGVISLGTFTEQDDYAKEYHLANKTHDGFGMKYRHTAPLQEWFGMNLEGESGLYVNGQWMSDVDYISLQHVNQLQNNVTSKQVISRVNAYYNTQDHYVGTYLKYYQYLDQSSNTQTIQTLPSFQYHRYLKPFWQNHLLLNADAGVTNFYRPEGKNALQGDFSVPLVFQTSLWDDYLEFSYSADTSAKMISFFADRLPGETGSDYSNGVYGKIDHTVALSSTLVRGYDGFSHVLSPFVSYTDAGNRYYSGYYKTYHDSGQCLPGSTNPACDYYTLYEPTDTLSLGLNNYVIDNQGKQTLADRISQNFVYDKQASYYGELQNELEWEVSKAVSYYNRTAYNHDRNRVTKEQNTLRYNGEQFTAGLNHYYTDVLRNNSPEYASYWTADASYAFNSRFRVFGSVAYDSREDIFKRGEVGFLYSRRCLDLGLRYVQNRRPILTNTNIDSVDESYLFITVILKPLGGSEFNYKLTNN
ncbi:MAG: LPS-assembly protein LptD [Sulfuricurvum sp.]